jgi:carboxypeptidase Taq
MANAYERLRQRLQDIGKLDVVEAHLEWDQEVMMPAKGVNGRAEVCAMVAKLRHEWRTHPELGKLLEELSDQTGDPVHDGNVREARRTYRRAVKVPIELVGEIAHTTAHARETWTAARRDNAFKDFAPLLGRIVDLKRRQAQAIGYEKDAYDALLDEFEPGATSANLTKLFAELRARLTPIVHALTHGAHQPDSTLLNRNFPRDAQAKLALKLAEEMGYDFAAGRLDISVHPFCTSLGPSDVRITTRYDENYLPPAIFGVMHEVGHALYEQGLDPAHAFTPAGASVSLGIHESQSRMWENFVGRSRAFWERHYPATKHLFPQALRDVDLDVFHAAINTVAPTFIRVEADEVTYNLHIVLRFEIERDLIGGRLEVADIPAAWNAKMQDLLGITPPTDRDGCLQDIHWSSGLFGYFPTYALGNLYAGQFWQTLRKAVPDLDARIATGDMRTLLNWLRENIHRHGQQYRPNVLCQRITGQDLSINPLLSYIEGKFRPLYGLT